MVYIKSYDCEMHLLLVMFSGEQLAPPHSPARRARSTLLCLLGRALTRAAHTPLARTSQPMCPSPTKSVTFELYALLMRNLITFCRRTFVSAGCECMGSLLPFCFQEARARRDVYWVAYTAPFECFESNSVYERLADSWPTTHYEP